MKSQFFFLSVFTTFAVLTAKKSPHSSIVDGLDTKFTSEAVKSRDLGTGGSIIVKKSKDYSKKDKLSKTVSKDKKVNIEKDRDKGKKEKGEGNGKENGNGKGTGEGNANEYIKKGKGMAKKIGKMAKGKTSSPTAIDPTTPKTPSSIPSIAPPPMPTPNPSTEIPAALETETPVFTGLPLPVAIVTDFPSITPTESITDSPVLTTPSVQPILVSPTNFVFVGTSNIVVRYESMDSDGAVAVTMNETMVAVELTCDYIRDEAIIPLGALEFACIWFLPEFDDNNVTAFPVEITYAGTAAFVSEEMNITREVLDASIINVMTAPLVQNLTDTFNTDLSTENPFHQTAEIFALV